MPSCFGPKINDKSKSELLLSPGSRSVGGVEPGNHLGVRLASRLEGYSYTLVVYILLDLLDPPAQPVINML